MTARSIILLCAVCLLAAGCAGETDPSFAPGEREHLHQLVKDGLSDYMRGGGQSAPTALEYNALCGALEKYQWEAGGRFHSDPNHTARLRSIAGGISRVFTVIEQTAAERDYAEYRISDFCKDVRSADTPAGTSPAPTSTPRPTPTPAPTSTPRPTPAPTATPGPTATPLPPLSQVWNVDPDRILAIGDWEDRYKIRWLVDRTPVILEACHTGKRGQWKQGTWDRMSEDGELEKGNAIAHIRLLPNPPVKGDCFQMVVTWEGGEDFCYVDPSYPVAPLFDFRDCIRMAGSWRYYTQEFKLVDKTAIRRVP